MTHSYRGSHGATFLYNPGKDGNVTIIHDDEHVTVSFSDLMEFARTILNDAPEKEAEAAGG